MKLVVAAALGEAALREIEAALGPGDVMVAGLEDSQLIEHAGDADAWLAGPFTPQILAAARKLRWVHGNGAGVEALLFPELVRSAVVVTNGRGGHAVAMSEYALWAMLSWTRRLPALRRARERRRWTAVAPEDLEGKTLGLLGYGGIGQAVAARARLLGVNAIALRRHPARDAGGAARVYGPDGLLPFLGASDFVFSSLPLTAETRGLLGEREFRAMRADAVFINVGRGQTVREPVLLRALREGWIAGAVLDVFEEEPLPPESPFWGLENVLVTCHSSGRSSHARQRVAIFCENLRRFREGRPLRNVVDKALGY
jgi:phosphoglycerate dehydrogenase-like enzyme